MSRLLTETVLPLSAILLVYIEEGTERGGETGIGWRKGTREERLDMSGVQPSIPGFSVFIFIL
jgi:hypothetical protein